MKHKASNPPSGTIWAPTSHPLGDWMPCTLAEIKERASGGALTFVWHPGCYGDEPIEICTGSQPNTYHVRLANLNGGEQ
jgi:hypothetical protein